MTDCPKWRPLAMKGICQCGQRFYQHSQAVMMAANPSIARMIGSGTEASNAERADRTRRSAAQKTFSNVLEKTAKAKRKK